MRQYMTRERKRRHPRPSEVPNGCRVILCVDANGEVDTTLPWIGSAGTRIRDRCKKWNQNGHELLEVLTTNQQHGCSMDRDCNAQEDKDAVIAFLPKPGKDIAQPHWQGMGKSISSSSSNFWHRPLALPSLILAIRAPTIMLGIFAFFLQCLEPSSGTHRHAVGTSFAFFRSFSFTCHVSFLVVFLCCSSFFFGFALPSPLCFALLLPRLA